MFFADKTNNNTAFPSVFRAVRAIELDGATIPQGTLCRAALTTAYGDDQVLSLTYQQDAELLLFPECVDAELFESLELVPTRELNNDDNTPHARRVYPIAVVAALALFVGWCLPQASFVGPALAACKHVLHLDDIPSTAL